MPMGGLAARRLGLLLFAALLSGVAGCWGGTSNPSYFPYWLPSCDVVQTHAKPIGPGYYANFDPHAIELDLEPCTMTSQVGSQVVVLATVRDEKGEPRRNRRIDWKVTNGNIIEVDESGYLPGRGWVEGNTATSYTSYGEDRITRGNGFNKGRRTTWHGSAQAKPGSSSALPSKGTRIFKSSCPASSTGTSA